MSKIEVNTVEPQCGTTLTLGGSGDTVALGSGASQTGFGRTGTVNWNTTKITADPANAVSGTGYFCDTSGGAFTVTLPTSPSAGDIVAVADYTRTFNDNNLTVGRNSKPIGGVTQDADLSVAGQSATFVFVDDTEGWININETQTSVTGTPPYIAATGGTPACGTICGDYKYHKFTGPGTFCVSRAAVCAADNLVSYMVVAGGGGGGTPVNPFGNGGAGGGGAGGFRELVSPTAPYTASPLDGYPTPGNRITVTASPYSITVGGGGGATAYPATAPSTSGNASIFSCITSAGGGGGGTRGDPVGDGVTGGSGSGAGSCGSGGAGNTPPTTPAQGTAGGPGGPGGYGGGGGGGATVVGYTALTNPPGGGGNPGTAPTSGTGATTEITGSPVAYAGGGGGGGWSGGVLGGNIGGTGGGGDGAFGPTCAQTQATAGTAFTGGGGGGGFGAVAPNAGGNGGDGVVVIRYKFQ